MSNWAFYVHQDDMVVASGFAPDRDTAMREANHYAMMYSTEGKVKWSIRKCPERKNK